jgi:hypothetical protein
MIKKRKKEIVIGLFFMKHASVISRRGKIRIKRENPFIS